MKKIAVLTSGGDAPGMNAAIRAVVRYGIYSDMEVYGVEQGYCGLIENKFVPMSMRSVSDTIHRGGTILRTARSPEFKTEDGINKAIKNLETNGIEGIIVIGGDGSFMGARALSKHGFPSVGIPGTIDNDLAYTDWTLGFDTACNTILDAVSKIRDTMSSHDRISIIEVMGRNCGDLALYCGLAGGAECIIVPEHDFDIDAVAEIFSTSRVRRKTSGLIMLAEGAVKASVLAPALIQKTGIGIKYTVLGYIQRGGSPSMRDRYLGGCWGVEAVKLLQKGIGNRIVGIRNNQIFDMDIFEGCAMKKEFNEELYNMATIISQ